MSFGWNDVGKMLADVAPTIAGGLVSIVPGGGFLAPVAALAVRSLEQALGIGSAAGQPPATPEQVAEAMAAGSPETLLKLRQADNDYQLALRKADIDIEKIAAGDRDSARQREVAVKDSTPRVLAYLITVGFFALLGMTAFHEIPAANQTIINIMIGVLGTAWVAAIQYFYGSTSGSVAKNNIIAGIAAKQ